MKKFAGALALALAVSTVGVHAATKMDAADAITAAVNATMDASAVGGEWRDTYTIIGEAKAAYQAGDYDKAIGLASTAQRQGELGKDQALAQKNASIPSYVYAK